MQYLFASLLHLNAPVDIVSPHKVANKELYKIEHTQSH